MTVIQLPLTVLVVTKATEQVSAAVSVTQAGKKIIYVPIT